MALNVRLERRISIYRKTVSQDATYGAAVTTRSLLATVYAERRDVLPSRSESVRQGLAQARDQVRYRIRHRSDVDASMEIEDGGEVFQIVGGPAELGRREYLEFVAERFTTQGGG